MSTERNDLGPVLLGTKLAHSVPLQLAIDLVPLGVLLVVTATVGADRRGLWIVLAALWVVIAVVRAVMVHRRRQDSGPRER